MTDCMEDGGFLDQCDDNNRAQITAWTECICNANCDNVPTSESVDTDELVSLSEFSDQSFSTDFYAGMSFVVPSYGTDPMYRFLRYELFNTYQARHGSTTVWDQFSAFYDIKWEFFEPFGKCMPFVKVEGLEEESWKILHTVDGVNAACAIEKLIAERYD